jgi:L-threonylcarbamoyladenylate synthase
MPARIHAPTPRNLRRLAALLRRGELVAVPTETVYGLAANALDARACRRIFAAKRRPADDPLIVHLAGLRAAEPLAEFNAAARVLARHFWPGPLTLVLPKKPVVPAIVTSGQPTVALRAPAHPLALRLIKLAGVPLAAPSANLFGYVSPTTAEHVQAGLGQRIGHILDGGACRIGVESTIVDVSEPGKLRILRPGAISARELLATLRRAGLKFRVGRKSRGRPMLVPGLLDQHYSPHTPLELRQHLGAAERKSAKPDTALIYRKKPAGRSAPNIFFFSRRGGLPDVARNLYAVLRTVDAAGFQRILVESIPARRKDALAAAINDRLVRAAGRRKNTL